MHTQVERNPWLTNLDCDTGFQTLKNAHTIYTKMNHLCYYRILIQASLQQWMHCAFCQNASIRPIDHLHKRQQEGIVNPIIYHINVDRWPLLVINWSHPSHVISNFFGIIVVFKAFWTWRWMCSSISHR
jgi:hypothetical protein